MQHKMGESCDCEICGWHVRDVVPLTPADTWVTSDTGCLDSRPRADQHLESPRGRRRSVLPAGRPPDAQRVGDLGQLAAAGEAQGAPFESEPDR
jgi:hypothetical protein